MFRVSLDQVSAHRTLHPLYEQHQATPLPVFLDASEGLDVYSGMVMRRSGEETVVLCDGAGTAKPLGLAALDHNATIDDMYGQSNVPFSVWIGAADAFFQIDSPAFDTGVSYAAPTDGTRQLLYGGTSTKLGQLTSADGGGHNPVAELWEVPSTTRIVVRLLPPGTTP